MAQNTYKANTPKKKNGQKQKGPRKKFQWKGFGKVRFVQDRRFQLAIGLFLLTAAVYLLTAFISFLFTGKADMSVIQAIAETGMKESGMEVDNWLGLFGAMSAHAFMFNWFGIASFLFPPFLFVLGYKIVFKKELVKPWRAFSFTFFFLFWFSLLMGYLVMHSNQVSDFSFLCGGIGYELAILFDSLLGWGTVLILLLSLVVFLIYFFNITKLLGLSKVEESMAMEEPVVATASVNGAAVASSEDDRGEVEDGEDENEAEASEQAAEVPEKPEGFQHEEPAPAPEAEVEFSVEEAMDKIKEEKAAREEKEAPDFSVETAEFKEKTSTKQVNDDPYDPTIDLSSYQYPTLDLLKAYDTQKVKVTQDELEMNKDKILETLTNFKIGINSIKATIGPTVTLYEIVPEPGVKISKIKNLEDDIALSLAALGIRIIAPIPGKGTIGIEVPNKNREMVSMRSVLSTDKFMKSDKELPVVLGKTISNEVYVADLAKMPHLLMAGATGQGKSVGLNVMLASLIYKKHPSQLKFVLVDPKKVELTLFNKIERHFLAMLPNSEEPIITDTKRVVSTLNSLCIEMDNRYDLLKDAGCRNLKEYNTKFVARRLNPEKGHRFLPYIVLVIDELADLMMTAGKEVETPIARLAQLARAIGIHLIIATQRPSVNVITGIIKANFPARMSFRVTSKVDSRTILDTGGAEQLVGQGDMLLSMGSDLIRLQCPFLDTPEVEDVCDFVGSQRGYSSAYMLPEFEEEESKPGEVDLSDRDELFEDAARLIVAHQQGSTSLIQRKLKLGYNRAGRLIDQLEAAGIVGPFEGSKAREVLIQDEYSLEQLLSSL